MLFDEKPASVSPSWVRFGKTSYAVRTITRLSFRKVQTPRIARYSLFFVSLALLFLSLMHLVQATLPVWLAYVLLMSSSVLMGFTAWLAFFKRPQYEVKIFLSDGSDTPTSNWKQETLAQGLHDAITRAMDWHRGNSGGGDADIIQNVAARRKSANAWRKMA